jgi:hypothetical protein
MHYSNLTQSIPTPNGNRSPFQVALALAAEGLAVHPGASVTYLTQPFLLLYAGPPFNTPGNLNTMEAQAEQVQSDINMTFSYRYMTGFIDSQPGLATTPPSTYPPLSETAPLSLQPSQNKNVTNYWWSFLDRNYSPPNDAFSSYTLIPGTLSNAVEFSVAGMTSISGSSSYPYLSVRNGEVVNEFMSRAAQMNPKFFLVGQFNQFTANDGGFTVPARLDVEPASTDNGYSDNSYDDSGYISLGTAITAYKHYVQGTTTTAHFDSVCIRGETDTGNNYDDTLEFDFEISGTSPERIYLGGMGYSLGVYFANEHFSTQGVTFAVNPQLALSTLSTGNTLSVVNSDYKASYTSVSAAQPNNPSPPGTTFTNSALFPRAFVNSAQYYKFLNYGVGAPTNKEPAITADVDPGTYLVLITDPGSPGWSTPPGTMAHALLTLGDTISATRVTNFSGRGWVASENGGNNNLILGFTIRQQKTFYVRALGPSLPPLLHSGTPVLTAHLTCTLYNSSQAVVQSWTGETATTITSLAPGLYTIVLSTPTGYNDGIGQLTIQEQSF